MKNKWNGILTILEYTHLDANGKILHQEKNLKNILHRQGENFLLTCCFDKQTGSGNLDTFPPPLYYFGLDNRTVLSVNDTMTSLIDEPPGPPYFGYTRANVSSSSQFAIASVDSIYRATSPIVTFVGTTTGWGPVRNLFLTNNPTVGNTSGFLISSVALSQPLSLANGESATFRMALSMQDIT